MLNSTVQMVLRRSLQHVTSRDIYFSGDGASGGLRGLAGQPRAHGQPRQLDRGRRDPRRGAHRGRRGGRSGPRASTSSAPGLSERLFDTPQAVARIWRSTAGRRTMILSAEDSRDANGRPLDFTWALLQGDPDKVTIEPLDDGVRARVTLDWHDPFRISEENDQIAVPRRHRRLRAQRRPRQRARRSSPGPSPRTRRGPTSPGPTARRGSSRSTTPTRPRPGPTPTPSSTRAPAGATPTATTPRAAPLGWTRTTAGRRGGRLRRGRRAGARRRRADGTPLQVAPVAYTLRPGPGGTRSRSPRSRRTPPDRRRDACRVSNRRDECAVMQQTAILPDPPARGRAPARSS